MGIEVPVSFLTKMATNLRQRLSFCGCFVQVVTN